MTDTEMDQLAEKAADKAVAKITANFYQEIGESVVKKVTFLIGVIVVGLYVFGQQHGWWK